MPIRITGLSLFLIAAFLTHLWTTTGTAQPAPDCGGRTGNLKHLCESDALRGIDTVLKKLSVGREGDETVKRAMKGVQRCPSQHDDCIERALMVAIVALAKKSGDAKGTSGRYAYRKGAAGGGTLWVARMPDGRLSGGISTVSGPTHHTCSLDFVGVELNGAAFEWVDPEPEAKGCVVKLIPMAGAFKIETTPRCQEHYCGMRGRMDFVYRRQ